MKHILTNKTFTKHYKLRVAPNWKLRRQFAKRLSQFTEDRQQALLFDHALTGLLHGKRAFSISGDIRVIYIESNEDIILLDIGTHAQVYQ